MKEFVNTLKKIAESYPDILKEFTYCDDIWVEYNTVNGYYEMVTDQGYLIFIPKQ